jgi:hypothetical protein
MLGGIMILRCNNNNFAAYYIKLIPECDFMLLVGSNNSGKIQLLMVESFYERAENCFTINIGEIRII